MPMHSGTVLLVDDDAAVRSALKFSLEVEGYGVRIYERAKALLAEKSLPTKACLVVDLRMPAMDGLELIEALRARGVGLPAILIVSEPVSAELRSRSSRVSVDRILEKPLSDSALLESIRRALVDLA
ncbi:MAG: response regulator [Enhydrobacter sp.]|nr:MAG: response regulator [Enhydrobacter sp.]